MQGLLRQLGRTKKQFVPTPQTSKVEVTPLSQERRSRKVAYQVLFMAWMAKLLLGFHSPVQSPSLGTAESRSLRSYGNTDINTATPQYILHIGTIRLCLMRTHLICREVIMMLLLCHACASGHGLTKLLYQISSTLGQADTLSAIRR